MPSFNNRTGETRIMNCGMQATIINYKNSHDISIKFEDGTILEHKYYGDFKNGKIENPKLKKDYQNRVGTKKIMNCGYVATLVAYRKNTDVDVQFEDGTLVQNRLYQDFLRGEIIHPKLKVDVDKIIGTKKTMHCGIDATIVAYRGTNDIDVLFDDGILVTNCSYSAFKGQRIQHPKNKITLDNTSLGRHVIGETRMMSCGSKATIIAYRTSKDLDVQFEDGEIIYNKSYSNFKNGKIEHPYIKPSASYPERVIAGYLTAAKINYKTEWSDASLRGENKKKPLYFDFAIFNKNNDVVLLIEYQGIQHFEKNELFGGDESFTRLKKYDKSKKEYAQNKKIKLLEIPFKYHTFEEIVDFLNNNLSKYDEIINIASFPILKENIKVSDIKTYRLGESKLMKCGMVATIIAYRNSADIDVKFEDGTIVTNVSYRRFVLQEIVSKDLCYKSRIAKERLGESKEMKNGMIATIINYHNAFDIDIKFSDGTIRRKQTYSNFFRGDIGNPNLPKKHSK